MLYQLLWDPLVESFLSQPLEQFKDKNLEKRRGTGGRGERERKWEKDLKFNIN